MRGGQSGPPYEFTRVVALMNQKGGVGKTTTVVNLAAALADSGRPTLVVDLDPQSHTTLHLGVEPESIAHSVRDLLVDEEIDPAKAIVEARPNLALIPATVDLAAVEVELAGIQGREKRLARALDRVRERYEFILLDCPPSLGLLTLNGLSAAKEVIVPMQAHFFALQGVGRLLETVSHVARGVNPKLRVSGVVLCMHDENTKHTREVVADLEGFFEASKGQDVPWRGARVYKPAIRRNIKLAECPSFGKTILEYSRWCAGALDYVELAKSFTDEWDRFLARRQSSESVQVITRPTQPATTA